MISGDAYIRKLRRMTGQKKERVNTELIVLKKAKMSNTKKCSQRRHKVDIKKNGKKSFRKSS